MTYWQFHLVFVLPALVATAVLYLVRTRDVAVRKHQIPFVFALAAIAFFYTTPWDNYLVFSNVWSYGPERVTLVLGYVPIEEYTFFLLQPLVTGLFLLSLRNSAATRGNQSASIPSNNTVRWLGALLISLIAACILLVRTESFTYLRLIIGWSLPVVAAQWLLGGDYFLSRFRTWATAIAISTVYFSTIDRVAIGKGIWHITEATSTGIMLLGLPIEEFLFFLITNVLVVQGLMLFLPYPNDFFRSRFSNASSRQPNVGI